MTSPTGRVKLTSDLSPLRATTVHCVLGDEDEMVETMTTVKEGDDQTNDSRRGAFEFII